MTMRFLIFSLFLALFIFAPTVGITQAAPAATESEFEEKYERRVRQERLYGVYVPKDLAEVFVQLNSLSEPQDRAKFRNLSEAQAATRPFFSLGRWMAVNWGFYGGSRLTVYLNQLELHHPDDMVRFLLIMYHRHLNKQSLAPQQVIEELTEKRHQAEQEQLLEGEVLYEEVRPANKAVTPHSGGKG